MCVWSNTITTIFGESEIGITGFKLVYYSIISRPSFVVRENYLPSIGLLYHVTDEAVLSLA